MIIIGEKINGMFPSIRKAIEDRDEAVIIRTAERQLEEGAEYLDINTGAVSGRKEAMEWLVRTAGKVSGAKLCIDSPNAEVLEAGLRLCRERPMLNSVQADPEKMDALFPMAKKYGAIAIGLAMNGAGIPADAEGRAELAATLIASANEHGLSTGDLLIDPVLIPLSADQSCAVKSLRSIAMIKELDVPAPRTVAGLSNISQRCSNRHLLNRTFLAMAMFAGLDAVIADTSDANLRETILAGRIILNKDVYCDSFMGAPRGKNS